MIEGTKVIHIITQAKGIVLSSPPSPLPDCVTVLYYGLGIKLNQPISSLQVVSSLKVPNSQLKTMVSKNSPDTSWAAAAAFTNSALTQIQKDVYLWFKEVGTGTDEELEVVLRPKYPAQTTVSKRRTDLVRKGFLKDSGLRKKNSNNRNMIVWTLTDKLPEFLATGVVETQAKAATAGQA